MEFDFIWFIVLGYGFTVCWMFYCDYCDYVGSRKSDSDD